MPIHEANVQTINRHIRDAGHAYAELASPQGGRRTARVTRVRANAGQLMGKDAATGRWLWIPNGRVTLS
jgi:uncharacterized protein (DUF2384 family)